MPKTCKVDEAWRGPCGKPTAKGSEYCKEHRGRTCPCGKQMTHECEHTGMSLICGAPMCSDNCKHGHGGNGYA